MHLLLALLRLHSEVCYCHHWLCTCGSSDTTTGISSSDVTYANHVQSSHWLLGISAPGYRRANVQEVDEQVLRAVQHD